jgi:hypothetical protein
MLKDSAAVGHEKSQEDHLANVGSLLKLRLIECGLSNVQTVAFGKDLQAKVACECCFDRRSRVEISLYQPWVSIAILAQHRE